MLVTVPPHGLVMRTQYLVGPVIAAVMTAGPPASGWVKSNSSPNYGFNAQTEAFGDLVNEGVIDPTKVTRVALQNAASIASLLLTTEALVSEYPDEEDKAPAGSPAGMGGGMY